MVPGRFRAVNKKAGVRVSRTSHVFRLIVDTIDKTRADQNHAWEARVHFRADMCIHRAKVVPFERVPFAEDVFVIANTRLFVGALVGGCGSRGQDGRGQEEGRKTHDLKSNDRMAAAIFDPPVVLRRSLTRTPTRS